ncbi:carcinoembryonic antigen-related cell adhesion molecule 1-like [Thunnus thynnus]|uniref:carcinoembryonic antigen-related cell adhesion molecule 1-like n=1 Tax=Thunnus thynnus TaxID=8237 RepID=UPI003527B26E
MGAKIHNDFKCNVSFPTKRDFFQPGGISGADIFLYYRPGDEAILPCDDVSSSDRVCSTVYWLYSRDKFNTFDLVQNGNVNNSARAARLSLDTNCSLVINNITAEDAGLYTCQQSDKEDIKVHLRVMTILPSPPDADPKRDGNVTLECSLLRYNQFGCRPNSFRWLNETGTVLLGEGVGYEIIGQTDCVSVLTVKRQSGHNRRYTCQWINKNKKVRIEADYTPVFTEGTIDDQSEKSNTGPSLYIITGAVVGVVVVVVVIIAVFIKFKKRHTVTEDFPKTVNPPDPQEPQDEPDDSLTYVTVNHANQKTASKEKVKEEEVTYSTVKTAVTMEADPSKIYSYVNE